LRKRIPRTYQLTDRLIAAHAGSPVICLDASAQGRTFRLHAERPGADAISWIGRADDGGEMQVIGAAAANPGPLITRVDIEGVIEAKAGYHDVCGGWTDGHDAIAERLCAAFAAGDVLLVTDSPGGACAGLQEGVAAVLKAKAKYGRRVTAWVGETCGSACAWWTLALADEVYVPTAGVIGSLGARATHECMAVALAQAGIEITHVTWPNDGKVATAPDRPLSEEGRSRIQRDVTMAGEAFAEAVAAGPVGRRHGLTVAKIVKLSADALTGRYAVDAGLADGVASLDDVTAYALALASGEEAEMATEYEKKTTIEESYSESEPEKDEAEDEDEKPDAEDSEDDADAEDEDPEKHADDDAPPSSKKPEAKAAAPKAMRQTHSLAEILGTSSDSMPALKTMAVGLRQLRDYAAKLTGQRSIGAIIGGLSALAEDAAASGKLRDELKSQRRAANARTRMDLLRQLEAANLPGYARGDLFLDEVSADGKRAGVKPAKQYAEMKLSTLSGLVKAKLANGPANARRRSPFDASRDEAERASNREGSRVTETDRQLASTTGKDPERIARARSALFGPNGVATR
jgi:ClpP class serine protease